MTPSHSGRLSTVALVVILVVVAVGSGGSAGENPAQTGEGDLEVDPDDVLLLVDVRPDGDAQWRMEYRMRLSTDEDVAAFEELKADIEANTSAYVTRHRERMERTAADGAAVTGREMAIEDVTVEAERRFVDREYGVVTYRFNWTNFARVEGDELHVGDALAGLFLTDTTDLVVQWPAGYERVEVAPEPAASTDRSVRWDGPVEFGENEPRLVATDAGGADGSGGVAGLPWWLLAGLLVVVTAVIAAGAYHLRGRSPAPPTDGAADADVDGELLSNEEQVLQLIERHGGRMKQQEVAEALDWTDAKTSKVVRTLREQGDLEGFRLGRENVLRLPEAEEP